MLPQQVGACLKLILLISLLFSEAEAARKVTIINVFSALTFNQPIGMAAANDGSSSLFVIEQSGIIKSFDRTNPSASVTLLDIRERVLSGGEQGLLGLALHPQFLTNGRLFLNYTRRPDGATVIARYQILNGLADPTSEQILLLVPQPFANHNGGQLAFGPDGFLYIGLGDGGGGGDPLGNAQNKGVLLGKILRIDVNRAQDGLPYAIPAGNPYAGNTQGFAPEIFAYGFRNPWRFSFDSVTKRLWAGDVGQDKWEEVDVVRKGGNYGWNIMEGKHCFSPPRRCPRKGLIMPVTEYQRSPGNAVIGGFVYRGTGIPNLRGRYIFGDFSSGRIWATNIRGRRTQIARHTGQISAFGVDQRRELYVVDYGGSIYELK